MTWHPGITAEIAVMFAGHSWHADELQDALERHVAHARQAARERKASPWSKLIDLRWRSKPENRAKAVLAAKAWREANRDKARKHSLASQKRRQQRAKIDPVFGEHYRALRNAHKKRQRAKNPEHWRELNRIAKRAERARKFVVRWMAWAMCWHAANENTQRKAA